MRIASLLVLALAAGCAGDPAAAVAFNEIQAVDTDWVELFNPTGGPIDLSGYQMTDGTGAPRVGRAMIFPLGTVLDRGAFLLVSANRDPALPGVQTDCVPGGPPTCYHAGWGIDRTNGESLYLLSPENTVVVEVAYPPAPVGDGQAWGRVPDGSGAFVATIPTPGAANRAF